MVWIASYFSLDFIVLSRAQTSNQEFHGLNMDSPDQSNVLVF